MNMRERQIEQSAVKIVFGVISFTVNARGEPNGVRNPPAVNARTKRDSSARSMPRNDKL